MIENSQKKEITSLEAVSPVLKHALPGWQPRRLRAIEIAEGALLADIGVIFQLLIRFIPIGGTLIQVLVPAIFAVIVLRRGFYVGCISLCVALFVIVMVMGPGGTPFLLLEAGAGLFLGLTMRQRLSHWGICIIGVLGGGAALWMVAILYAYLGGGPAVILRTLHLTYAALTREAGLLLGLIGLGPLWHERIFPWLDTIMQWGFHNWLLFLYLSSCLGAVPLVLGVYFLVNFFLRVLGYRVRPFPGYRLEGWLHALVRGIFKLVPRRVLRRFSALYRLKAENRRLNISRLRQRRLEKEARGKA